MPPWMIITAIGTYFLLLLSIGWITGKRANRDSYFVGNRQSIWWLVAIGMLSDSMSGVSFISVPGDVYKTQFYYMQLVMGYVLGYAVIAFVLLPLYYRMGLTSIYSYLGTRFGLTHQRVGAGYFVLSRLLGSAGRLFLTASILQVFLFNALGFPFWASVALIICLILAYTIRGGIRTLVFTDALQSVVLLSGLIITVGIMVSAMPGHSVWEWVADSGHASWFDTNPLHRTYFWKHFIGGAVVCIAMTGLDQNMMQKNLSCRSLKEAQKNIITTGAIVFFVNIIFVSLGALMIQYLASHGLEMPVRNGKAYTDAIFPMLALKHLGTAAGLAFILGLAAATFSSADSVLTSLTTSVYIDFLRLDVNEKMADKTKSRYRNIMHAGFAVLLLLCILAFEKYNNQALITTIFDIAGITYGPLLGLFAFGIFTSRHVSGTGAVLVCLIAPALTWYLKRMATGGYEIGFEALLINGVLTFAGLWLASLLQRGIHPAPALDAE